MTWKWMRVFLVVFVSFVVFVGTPRWQNAFACMMETPVCGISALLFLWVQPCNKTLFLVLWKPLTCLRREVDAVLPRGAVVVGTTR